MHDTVKKSSISFQFSRNTYLICSSEKLFMTETPCFAGPTICFNNVTKDINGTVLNHFICPMFDQPDSHIYCCGSQHNQRCCTQEEHNPDDDYIPILDDLDVV